MAADFFAYAVAYVLQNEGASFVNDPVDRGGATRYGISTRTLDGWRAMHHEPQATIDDVRNLTQAEAEAIYHALYFNAVRGGQIDEAQVACALLDVAVLCGVRTATKLAQGILGLDQDGIFGPKTLAAVNSHSALDFLTLFVPALKEYLYRVCVRFPVQSRFYRGWIDRANRLMRQSVPS